MIKIERIDTWGFEHAIRGMRAPMQSWEKSDTGYKCDVSKNGSCNGCAFKYDWCGNEPEFTIGPNDLSLMQKLYKAGTEHRKFMRQIFVSMDITAPLYWWKQADQYRINVTTNSTSTMHKIAAKEFCLEDFSTEHLYSDNLELFKDIINCLNADRELYLSDNHDNAEEKKNDWWQMIQMLPSSYNQLRTVTMTYENVANIVHQRSHHKLDEWREFCNVMIRSLPYFDDIIDPDGGVSK